MQPTADFVKHIETEYLRIVSDLLRSGDIDMVLAKESAQNLLSLLPFNTYEDMQGKIKTFTEKYKFAEKLYVIFLSMHEEDKTNDLLNKMRDLMKSNNIDAALHLVK
jgi:hypothetical protein